MILSSSFPRTAESNEELLEELSAARFSGVIGVSVGVRVDVRVCVDIDPSGYCNSSPELNLSS